MLPSPDGPLHSPKNLPRLLSYQGLKDPSGNSAQGAWRRPVPICVLQNGCRGAATAQIISQEFRRCCLHKQAGRTGISHCWPLSTGRSGDTHVPQAALLHAKGGGVTVTEQL